MGETTTPSSSLLIDDQALPSDGNNELVIFCDVEETVIVNLIADIDEITTTIPDTKTVILGTSETDCNTSVSVGTKEITVSTEPCGLCNCTNNESLFCTILLAAEKPLQHGTGETFGVIPRKPPAKQPPPEPPTPEPPPTGAIAICIITSIYGETLSRMGRMQFYSLLKDLFLEFKTPTHTQITCFHTT